MALPTKRKWRVAERPPLNGLVHRHVVTELVLIEREFRASSWPDRELGDGDEELDKPLGHVGEHSILTAAASHLQK